MAFMSKRAETPNVYGVETEYSAMFTLPGDKTYEIVGKCHSIDEPLGLYKEPKSKGTDHIDRSSITDVLEDMGLYSNPSGMLSNGGRFYIDPSGPEYATPETSTAEEAVHRVFDGDDIMLDLFGRLRESGVLQDFQLNRRIVDHNRTSRGIHLNNTTSLPADIPSVIVMSALATLNVAKGAMFGSGGLLINDRGKTDFHHSPRLSITSITGATYQNYQQRPLVRYPFKEDGELARVETVTSDALSFAWPLRASLVITNSLLRVIEQDENTDFPILRNPVKAAHIVGQYGYKNQIAVYRENEKHEGEKPLNILKEICEIVLDANEELEVLDDEAKQVLPEIIDVADRMSDNPESVANQVESVARMIAMRKKMGKEGVKLYSEKMCRFDYAWDWIGGGIAETLRNKNVVGWQGFKTKHSPRTADKRRNSPPVDTRAKIRGDLIQERAGDVDIDWSGTDRIYLHPLDTVLE
ncbi:MAG TPA: proteasome accessory factor PafA2 family protein [Candidatus Saccharimonadales bacterium]|nr:proteasome accessory factor PafA2 family protein [Candidatus Saccharimonadales bacterium]